MRQRRRPLLVEWLQGDTRREDDAPLAELQQYFFDKLLAPHARSGLRQVAAWKDIVDAAESKIANQGGGGGAGAVQATGQKQHDAPWSQPRRSFEVACLLGPLYRASRGLNRRLVASGFAEWPTWLVEADSKAAARAELMKQPKWIVGPGSSEQRNPFVVAAEPNLDGELTLMVLPPDNLPPEDAIVEAALLCDDRGLSLTGATWFLDVFELVEFYIHSPYGSVASPHPQQPPIQLYLAPSEVPRPTALVAHIFPVNLRWMASLRVWRCAALWAAVAWAAGVLVSLFVVALFVFAWALGRMYAKSAP